MMLKKIILSLVIALAISVSVFAQNKTIINDTKAEKMLSGKHKLSLQWISWDYFGTANVTKRNGVFYLKGSQKGRGKDASDFLKIDGVITSIDAKSFSFSGKITTRISHINNGEACEREGDFTFKITGKRKYWRMQEIDNPCEAVADYVDIYFR